MFIKRTLGAFTNDTRIEVHTNDDNLLNYDTVGEFMASGLMTYSDADQSSLTIKNDTIIIHLNY